MDFYYYNYYVDLFFHFCVVRFFIAVLFAGHENWNPPKYDGKRTTNDLEQICMLVHRNQ